MPPWLEQAPCPPLLIVPSVHFTIAVFVDDLAVDLPAAFVVSAGFAGFAAGAVVFAVLAALDPAFVVSDFFTPP